MIDGSINKRYYYTEPLPAIWMAKHFGMEFDLQYFTQKNMICKEIHLMPSMHDNNDGLVDAEGKLYSSTDLACLCIYGSFIVRKSHEVLLSPIIGDICLNPDNLPALVISNDKPLGQYEIPISQAVSWVGISATIIHRNSKAFHYPEWETK